MCRTVSEFDQFHGEESGYLNSSTVTYFNMLKNAYGIIKAHNSSDTVVCLGGDNIYYAGFQTMYVPDYDWAQSLWSLGAAKYCDAISLHAYTAMRYLMTDVPALGNGKPGNQTLGQIFDEALSAYEALTGKPIWITETGIPSNNGTGYTPPLDNSPQRQALFLNQTFSLFASRAYVKAVFWFDLSGYSNSPWNFDFGLVSPSGAAKPALLEFQSFSLLGHG
jgi:hypothetical protein